MAAAFLPLCPMYRALDGASTSGLSSISCRYYGKNVWPEVKEEGVEGFEEAFKA